MKHRPERAKTKNSYLLMVSSYIALLLVLLLQTFASSPEDIESTAVKIATGLVIWLIKVLILLIFIPGFFSYSHKNAAWCAYIALFYFVLSIKLIFTPDASIWGWLMTSSSISLFMSAMFFTRWQKEEEKEIEKELEAGDHPA